jgi:hypothetical protein
MGPWSACSNSSSSSANEPPRDASSTRQTVAFADVTESAGLTDFHHQTGAFGEKWFPETMGSGGGFLDYDGDGLLDILLVGGGVWAESNETLDRALWLYRNNGDGSFTLATEDAGLGDVDAYGFGVVAADYDNDGDQDFLFTTLNRNLLFRNEGDGTFTEVGQAAGLTAPPRWSSSATFFDADRDGYLDLYVGNYVRWSKETDLFCSVDGTTKGYCTPEQYEGAASRFYLNNGDGTFTDRTEDAGFLPTPGKTLGAAILDYNKDGWIDLAVANDQERDLLYENNGDGTFTERGVAGGIAYSEDGVARAGMGIDAGVVDTTGETSVFVGNFSREMIGVYRHLRNGLFVDRASVSQVGRSSLLSLTFGLFLIDAELDGDLDLFAANGHVQSDIEEVSSVIRYRQPAQLFMNDGTGRFEEMPAPSGPFALPLAARGAAYGDYDRDGDVDILLTENDGAVHLWRNDVRPAASSDRPHYLRVQLTGTDSNRDGIGARVELEADGVVQERLVRSGSSYLAASELAVTFGLGSTSQIDRLTVHWPSGHTDQTNDVDANQTVRVVEGMGLESGTSPVATAASPRR